MCFLFGRGRGGGLVVGGGWWWGFWNEGEEMGMRWSIWTGGVGVLIRKLK